MEEKYTTIKEVTKIMETCSIGAGINFYEQLASKLYKEGYRKITDCVVILTIEEYKKLKESE